MLDINFIKKNPDVVKADLKKRGATDKISWVDDLLVKEEEYRSLSHAVQTLRTKRNELTSQINIQKKKGEDVSGLIAEMKEVPKQIKEAETKQQEVRGMIDHYMQNLPNILHESVPVGGSDEDNEVVKSVGDIPPYDFELRSHVDLLEMNDFADTQKAAEVASSRFYYLKGDLALMEIALQRFAVDILLDKGFLLMEVPLMINRKAISGAVQLQDFEDVIYKIEDEDLYMIGTSEHSMACYHMNEVIPSAKMPVRYMGLSSCFRKEAGSHGKDTKGIFRVHQFNKIEMFVFSSPEDSWKIHEELISHAEELFTALELPYRVVNVCTGDIGAIAAKKYDLEVWMPVQKKYREMVSCSNCTDYQSRKLGVRFGEPGLPKQPLVHTLNSTAVATARCLAAILENNQLADGRVRVPKVLVPYMNGKEVIGISQ